MNSDIEIRIEIQHEDKDKISRCVFGEFGECGESGECVICYEPLPASGFATPCCRQQALHSECFNACIQRFSKCPICNAYPEPYRIHRPMRPLRISEIQEQNVVIHRRICGRQINGWQVLGTMFVSLFSIGLVVMIVTKQC